MIEDEHPLNIWVSPECKYWGNFSRWNSGRNPATAAKIQAGRKREKGHLQLCTELFWHQVSLGRHFHTEQPQRFAAAAKDKEIKAWLHHRTVQKVSKGRIPEHAVMRCRWLLTWKGANGDETPGELALNGKRAKARLVIIGYEDPDISTIKNDSPTLSKDGRQTALQQVSSHRWPL